MVLKIRSPVLMTPSPAPITPSPLSFTILPDNIFFNKLAANVLQIHVKNSTFCFFALFLNISVSTLISKTNFSRDLTIFTISFIHFLVWKYQCILLEPNIFFWLAAFAADAAALNPDIFNYWFLLLLFSVKFLCFIRT